MSKKPYMFFPFQKQKSSQFTWYCRDAIWSILNTNLRTTTSSVSINSEIDKFSFATKTMFTRDIMRTDGRTEYFNRFKIVLETYFVLTKWIFPPSFSDECKIIYKQVRKLYAIVTEFFMPTTVILKMTKAVKELHFHTL